MRGEGDRYERLRGRQEAERLRDRQETERQTGGRQEAERQRGRQEADKVRRQRGSQTARTTRIFSTTSSSEHTHSHPTTAVEGLIIHSVSSQLYHMHTVFPIIHQIPYELTYFLKSLPCMLILSYFDLHCWWVDECFAGVM